MKLNPYFEVLLAAAIWGSAGPFVKYLNLPPTSVTFFRLAVPSLILLVYLIIKKAPLFKGDNKLILIISSLSTVRMYFYFVGFTLTSIANAIIMFYTWPIFVAVLSAPLIKEKAAKKMNSLIGLAFLGIVLMYLNKNFSLSDHDFIGMGAMLISSLLNAVSMIVYKKEAHKYSKYEMIFYQNIIGAVVFLPFIFINSPKPTFVQINIAIIYAILIGLIGFSLYFSALRKIKVSTASFLSYMELVSGVIFGVILFHEKLTWNMTLGGLLIVASTLLLRKEEMKIEKIASNV